MPKFYDYIMMAELAENPYTSPPGVNTYNHSLYLSEETVVETRSVSMCGNIRIERIGS